MTDEYDYTNDWNGPSMTDDEQYQQTNGYDSNGYVNGHDGNGKVWYASYDEVIPRVAKKAKKTKAEYDIRWFQRNFEEQRNKIRYNKSPSDYTSKTMTSKSYNKLAGQTGSSMFVPQCYTIGIKTDKMLNDYCLIDESLDSHTDESLYTITSKDERTITEATKQWAENDKDPKSGSQFVHVLNAALEKKKKTFDFTLDSASTDNIMTMEAACLLFDTKASDLKLMGVSGVPTSVDVEGKLLITVSHKGKEYRVDLGTTYGVAGCPLNILSISKLIKQRAAVHFEADNCYIVLDTLNHPTRIPIIEVDGMFRIKGGFCEDVEVDPTEGTVKSKILNEKSLQSILESEAEPTSQISHSLNAHCYAISGDIGLWHRRVRHHNPNALMKIFNKGSVQGFKVKNPPKTNVKCNCESCKLAKLQRIPTPKSRPYSSCANVIGHTVSVDIKSVGVDTHRGYKYVICFVGHYSHLSMQYFMRSKTETTKMLDQYIKDMWKLGKIKIINIQTDRGSEFFEQEGDSKYNHGRQQHEFGLHCETKGIKHIKIPVEEKEKLAEQWNKEHFRSANTMLLEARLSPIFWADAVAYSSYQFNRIPNNLNPEGKSPWTMLTGEIPRWDTWKVFGCDTYEHVPNNKYDKVPGVPRGRKQIFIGFKEGFRGHVLFDPVTRISRTCSNCYFDEDFTSRQNALFFYDRRRELLRQKKSQPLVVDDFDQTHSEIEARKVFLDTAETALVHDHLNDTTSSTKQPQVIEIEADRLQHSQGNMIRPVRTQRPGKEAILSHEDKEFIKAMEITDSPCVFQKPCPKNIHKDSGDKISTVYVCYNSKRGCSIGSLAKGYPLGLCQRLDHISKQ